MSARTTYKAKEEFPRIVRNTSPSNYNPNQNSKMKKTKHIIAVLLGTLAASVERLRTGKMPVPLANELGLMNQDGIETLQIDPAATLPIGSRHLVYERGAAYNYGRLAGGVNLPLGISSDSPYAIGDLFDVRRFGAKKGLEIGIPGGAIAQDHLIVVATDGSGHVLDLTAQGNGTYWVIGRCVKACQATDIEVGFVPCTPYEITVSNGGGTYAFAGAGV